MSRKCIVRYELEELTQPEVVLPDIRALMEAIRKISRSVGSTTKQAHRLACAIKKLASIFSVDDELLEAYGWGERAIELVEGLKLGKRSRFGVAVNLQFKVERLPTGHIRLYDIFFTNRELERKALCEWLGLSFGGYRSAVLSSSHSPQHPV